jgi:hypothetical protein
MVNGDAPSLPRVIGVWGARSGSTQGEKDVAQQAFATSGPSRSAAGYDRRPGIDQKC